MPSFAYDPISGNPEDVKFAAAMTYVEVHPSTQESEELLLGLPIGLSKEIKWQFIKLIASKIDYKVIDSIVVKALIKTYSTEQIVALTENDTESEGYKSAKAKWWAYIIPVMEPVKKELKRATTVFFDKKAENDPELQKIWSKINK